MTRWLLGALLAAALLVPVAYAQGARGGNAIEMAHLQIPSPLNPLGVKGLGEGGAVGAHAAVANAVADALRPLGVEVRGSPLTPFNVAELMRTAADEGRGQAGS